LLLSSTAAAEVDRFGLGDGHLGPLVVSDAGTVINRYAALSQTAPSGAAVLQLASSDAGFLPGDLVLVLQVQAAASADAGDQGPFMLANALAGNWELARVADAGAGSLVLTAPLTQSFSNAASEVILVPEYSSVSVSASAGLVARAWDGQTGGVLAFLSTGPVRNDGVVSASAAGFRGGLPVDAPNQGGCIDLNQPAPQGAQKGEGLALGAYGPLTTGFGNVLNGAGGGNCFNAGGGGGGNGGVGGRGGWTQHGEGSNPVGGMGGASLLFSPLTRLVLGGGGGAGQENAGASTAGGTGGGVIFIRALSLTGGGVVSSDGQSAANAGGSASGSDGAGGGGGGGTVYVRLVGVAQCGQVTANGGNGGSTPETHFTGGPVGPGGGGAGGVMLVQASDLTGCATSAEYGMAGEQPDPMFPPFYGATPDDGGFASGVGNVTRLATGYLSDEGADGGSVVSRRFLRVGCGCTSNSFCDGLPWVASALFLRRRKGRATDH
jgi:hypothetical protein